MADNIILEKITFIKLDDDGNLIGVQESVDFESREVSDVETTQLRNEMLMANANANKDNTIIEETHDSLEDVD